MIRASSHDDSALEQTLIRLEISQAVVAKLFAQRAAIQPQPDRLEIKHDSQRLHFSDGLGGHEVCMRDAWPRRGDWEVVVDLGVGVNHSLNSAVAYRMRGELQLVLQGKAGGLVQPVGLEVAPPPVGWGIDWIELSGAPRP